MSDYPNRGSSPGPVPPVGDESLSPSSGAGPVPPYGAVPGQRSYGAGTGGRSYSTEAGGREGSSPARERVAERGHEAYDQARQKADDLKQGAAARAGEEFDRHKSGVADEIDDFAEAIRQSAHTMEERGKPNPARYVGKAADAIEGLADSLRRRDLNEVAREVTRFAQDRPALFIGGAVALGFALSRFAKAGSGSSAGSSQAYDDYDVDDDLPGTETSRGGVSGFDPETGLGAVGTGEDRLGGTSGTGPFTPAPDPRSTADRPYEDPGHARPETITTTGTVPGSTTGPGGLGGNDR